MKLTKLNPWNWFKHEEQKESKPVSMQNSDQPLASLVQLQHEMNEIFDRTWRQFSFPEMGISSLWSEIPASGMLKPSVDITSSDKQYNISVEVPGVDQEDLHLELADGALIVRGEKLQNKDFKEQDTHRIERSYGSFQRVLSIPTDAETKQIEAKFENGILNISLPRKAAALSDGEHIEIKRAS